jgi:hypothetical protein
MKQNIIYTLAALLTIALSMGGCSKEEKNPTLVVHVQETSGALVRGATVRAWPGQINTGGVVNEKDVDQTGTTDAAGDVTFEFGGSVVLDIDVLYYRTSTTLLLAMDTLEGHRVVKLEAVRQVSDENITYETVVVE